MARRLSKKQFGIVVGIGVVLVAFALFGLVQYLVLRYTGSNSPGEVVVTSSGLPSERAVEVDDTYTVPDDRPRRILISSIGVDAYIQRVGITDGGAMAAPNNIFFGGWYVHGVVPGEPGLAVINGHEGGSYSDGVFTRLHELKKGDRVSVEMGDRSLRVFIVERVESIDVAAAATALLDDDPAIERELRLVTCGGSYNASLGTFDRRIIVTTQYID